MTKVRSRGTPLTKDKEFALLPAFKVKEPEVHYRFCCLRNNFVWGRTFAGKILILFAVVMAYAGHT